MSFPSPQLGAADRLYDPAPRPSHDACAMTPFRRIARDAVTSMIEREVLLAQPDEFFFPFFGGRAPTLEQRLQFVEQALVRMTSLHIFENNLYRVEIAYHGEMIQLTITRHDREIARIVPRDPSATLLPPKRVGGSHLALLERHELRSATSIDELIADKRDR